MKNVNIDWTSVIQFLNTFIVTFIPLFVVVDPIGNLPFIVGLSETEDKVQSRRTVDLAVITATLIGLVFCSWESSF